MVQKNSRRRLDRTFPVQQRSCFRGTQDRVCSSRKCIFSWSLRWRSIQRPAGLSNEHSSGRGGRRMSDHGCWRRGSGVGCQLSACRASNSAGGEYRAAHGGSGSRSCARHARSYGICKVGATDFKGKITHRSCLQKWRSGQSEYPDSVRVDAVRGNPDRSKKFGI